MFIRACHPGKDQKINTYTENRYALGIIYDFLMLWNQRDFLLLLELYQKWTTS